MALREALGIAVYHGLESSAQLSSMAREAEDSGFHSIWVTERYYHEEAFSMLGILCSSTNRIGLGLAVANPYTRSPALIAMGASTIHRLSGKRMILCLGRSERDRIEESMGIPYGEPIKRMKDTMLVLKALLSGEEVSGSYEGFSLKGIRLEPKPLEPRPKLLLAAIGPRALKLASSIADGVVLNAYSPIGYVKHAIGLIEQGMREAGRSLEGFTIACMIVVRLGEYSIKEMKRRIASLLIPKGIGELLIKHREESHALLAELRKPSSIDRAHELIDDDMVDEFYAFGDANAIRRRIDDYRRAGINLPIVLPRLEEFRKALEL